MISGAVPRIACSWLHPWIHAAWGSSIVSWVLVASWFFSLVFQPFLSPSYSRNILALLKVIPWFINAKKYFGQKLSLLVDLILKLTSSKSISNSKFLHEPRYSPNHKRVLPASNSGITEVLQVISPTLNSIQTLYPPQPIPLWWFSVGICKYKPSAVSSYWFRLESKSCKGFF